MVHVHQTWSATTSAQPLHEVLIPDTHFSGRRVLSVEIIQAPVPRIVGKVYVSSRTDARRTRNQF